MGGYSLFNKRCRNHWISVRGRKRTFPDPYFTLCTKPDVNSRAKIMKLLEENRKKSLCPWGQQGSLRMQKSTNYNILKINKFDVIKV